MGAILAERYRPELLLLELHADDVVGLQACRMLSNLASRSRRRCRVVAGITSLTDAVLAAGVMAGAAEVTAFPFTERQFRIELGRLEERLGPRRPV
jgi:DNA-binding response OmpR family regulator